MLGTFYRDLETPALVPVSVFISFPDHGLILSLFPVAPKWEHRASVKDFVSLPFPNPWTVGRTI
jgi:hypothetical protein